MAIKDKEEGGFGWEMAGAVLSPIDLRIRFHCISAQPWTAHNRRVVQLQCTPAHTHIHARQLVTGLVRIDSRIIVD